MYTLLFLSGGTGTRMNNTIPKQYMLLDGKPVIMHTLERVQSIDEIDDIVIVCAKEYESAINAMLSQYRITKPVQFAPAGDTRQQSVYNGLQLVHSDDLILHEAARPFVKIQDFRRLIAVPERNATFGSKIPFSVLKGHHQIEGLLDRSELFNVQLPQKFETRLFKESHQRAADEGREFTEDAGIIFLYHPEVPIVVCPGMGYNIKLTTPLDFTIAQAIIGTEFKNN